MNQGFSISKLNFLLVLFLSFASVECLSQTNQPPFSINESPLPAPTSPVMDYAGVLDAGTKQAVEQKIIQFRDRTNPKIELAVAIVKTTGDRPIFEYSLAVARGWGIGSKQDDNPSALLFIAIDDRKYFTQISKDLEDELPDGLAGQLQRQYLVPAFKQGNYSKGVADTIDAYISTIEKRGAGVADQPTGGATNQDTRATRNSEGSFGGVCGTVVCLIILFVILISVFSRFGSSRSYGGGSGRRRGSNWGGGGFGGSAVPWIVGSIIASSMDNSRGSSSDWGGDSSGWSSGGGGGSDWGGFGGGGDFGGGGAGGDW